MGWWNWYLIISWLVTGISHVLMQHWVLTGSGFHITWLCWRMEWNIRRHHNSREVWCRCSRTVLKEIDSRSVIYRWWHGWVTKTAFHLCSSTWRWCSGGGTRFTCQVKCILTIYNVLSKNLINFYLHVNIQIIDDKVFVKHLNYGNQQNALNKYSSTYSSFFFSVPNGTSLWILWLHL